MILIAKKNDDVMLMLLFTPTYLEIESIEEFENFLERDAKEILKSFKTAHTFNETDQVLQNVKYWPNIATVGYFKTKLKFQIQHSLFR